MANKYMKRCSTLLNIREMQVKSQLDITSSQWLLPKKQTKTEKNTKPKYWWGCREGAILVD